MGITKGAKKAHRQSLKKKTFNDRKRNAVKDSVKAVRVSVSKKDKVKSVAELKAAYKALDKAAKIGVIKKGNANRRKSRLAKAIAKLG